MVLHGSPILHVEPRFSTRMIGHQMWHTIAEPTSPVHQPIEVILETCGDSVINVEVTSAGAAYKLPCSSAHFAGAFGTGCLPMFGATSSLPFPVPMSAFFTSVYGCSISFLRTIEVPRSFHSTHIAGASISCSCCRPHLGSLFEFCACTSHIWNIQPSLPGFDSTLMTIRFSLLACWSLLLARLINRQDAAFDE